MLYEIKMTFKKLIFCYMGDNPAFDTKETKPVKQAIVIVSAI